MGANDAAICRGARAAGDDAGERARFRRYQTAEAGDLHVRGRRSEADRPSPQNIHDKVHGQRGSACPARRSAAAEMKLHVIGIMESIVPYYLLLNDEISHVWKIDSSAAERVGVTNSRGGANTYLEPDSGQPIWETLACRLPVWFGPHATAGLHKLKLAPGKYYPRMARPLDQHPNE